MEHLKFLGVPGSTAAHMFLDFPAWSKGETRVLADDVAQAKGFAGAAALVAELKRLYPGLFKSVTPPSKPAAQPREKE